MTGTAGSNGWFRSNVTIHWVVTESASVTSSTGCELAQLVTTEGQSSHTCTVTFSGGSTSTTATVKIDKTAPGVGGATLARAPDSNGWFNHPVAAAFSGQDARLGHRGLQQPDVRRRRQRVRLASSGTCTDVAGNSSGASLASSTTRLRRPSPRRRTASRTARAGTGSRVTVSFAGTDATSGIAACTAPTRYAGPDLPKAAVVGACRDAAGNAAEAGQAFQYDATAPKLPVAKAEVEKGVRRSSGSARRTPCSSSSSARLASTAGRRPSSIEATARASPTGPSATASATATRSGRATWRGTWSQKAVTANVDLPALYRPAAGAVVHAPLVLSWEAVKGATFYNVQLYRNKVKVLTFWPRDADLPHRQDVALRRQAPAARAGQVRLVRLGREGDRAKPQYGKLLGSNSFVVK